jgi:hypothetical protein
MQHHDADVCHVCRKHILTTQEQVYIVLTVLWSLVHGFMLDSASDSMRLRVMRFAPVNGSLAVFRDAGKSVRGLSAETHAADSARQHKAAAKSWALLMLGMCQFLDTRRWATLKQTNGRVRYRVQRLAIDMRPASRLQMRHMLHVPRQTPTPARHVPACRQSDSGLTRRKSRSSKADLTQPRLCKAARCDGVRYAAMDAKRRPSAAAKRRSCCPSASARSMLVMGSSRKSMSSRLSSSASSATA